MRRKAGLGIGPHRSDPLPVAVVVRLVAVDEQAHEEALAPAPVDAEVLGQERADDQPGAIVHPPLALQLPHPRVDQREAGAPLAPRLELISPWTFAALAASVFAFYASARGLQLGPGVEVIALTSVAANLIAIIGGILVFRDSIGTGALEITGRMLAFGLVVAGAALIPAPLRAARLPAHE
jgi:hypothetical protein